MAVSGLNFASQVDSWVQATEARMTAVFRQATQETVSKIQSRVPIDLGFARASVMASTSSMPPINPGKTNEAERAVSDGAAVAQVALTIAGAKFGQTIYVGWTAAYMGPLEFGHSKQAPLGFVGITAREWPQIVDRVVTEAKARSFYGARPGVPSQQRPPLTPR